MILFCSDLHLDAGRPHTLELFEAFLAGPAREASALYILGDLFEYWAGDDDDEPFNDRVCAALRKLSDGGTAVSFLRGNRDFLAGKGFAARTGAAMLDDLTVADVEGIPALLLHGDTLCTDDPAYQAFRAEVRSDTWQRSFLARSLAERKAEIAALRARSERSKREKTDVIMDVSPAAVGEAFDRTGVARIIHGHTHRPACHGAVDGTRQRWVLPEWTDRGGCLVCDGGDWRLMSYDGKGFQPL